MHFDAGKVIHVVLYATPSCSFCKRRQGFMIDHHLFWRETTAPILWIKFSNITLQKCAKVKSNARQGWAHTRLQ